MAMEPEARIAPPEGNGEPLENMSGGRERAHGAGSVAIARPRQRTVKMASSASPPSVSATMGMHSTPASRQAGRLEVSLRCTPT